jgi:hypothetical protein
MMREANGQLKTVIFGIILLSSCDRRPSRVEVPNMQPNAIAKAAMQQCDKDGNGFIDQAEADAAPGLKAGWKRLDSDSDGRVAADEIADRIQVWLDSKLGAMTYGCEIQFQGQPLEGATVTLEPEPFFGSLLPSAAGTTGPGGTTYPMPTTPNALGMSVGYYRVRVSKRDGTREMVPANYNRETELGVEVAGDCEGVATPSHVLHLE